MFFFFWVCVLEFFLLGDLLGGVRVVGEGGCVVLVGGYGRVFGF